MAHVVNDKETYMKSENIDHSIDSVRIRKGDKTFQSM